MNGIIYMRVRARTNNQWNWMEALAYIQKIVFRSILSIRITLLANKMRRIRAVSLVFPAIPCDRFHNKQFAWETNAHYSRWFVWRIDLCGLCEIMSLVSGAVFIFIISTFSAVDSKMVAFTKEIRNDIEGETDSRNLERINLSMPGISRWFVHSSCSLIQLSVFKLRNRRDLYAN